MIYQGKALECLIEEDAIAHLKFDLVGQSANVFNALTLKELGECIEKVKQDKNIKGLLISSKKDQFIFGADITEFLGHFKLSDEEMTKWLGVTNDLFNSIEDLPYPTITAINGFALGGGLEVCLTTDFRLAGKSARIGLLETKLGIIPGWGGTVRLSRMCGADHAIEWITSGKQFKADAALKVKAVDGVVADEVLIESAKTLLKRAINGDLDWKAKRQTKLSPLKLDRIESTMVFETSKGFVAGVAGPNYPAPVKAIEVIQAGSTKGRDEALKFETKAFVECARTETAECLVTVFLGDQYLKKTSKKMTKASSPVNKAAVLGAGIMGGGIAYQSASKGTPIVMKDINDKALDLGLNEASNLLGKLVKRNRITPQKVTKTLNSISATLNYGDFNTVDLVVEAVVENEKIKGSVLKEVEENSKEGTILTSNTSTISITSLAKNLKKPENFCGMHFFNPVHKMPLVEVIRGEKSSDKAIAATVAYATKMGKTPIVVNDCAGFLVNRILFPYFNGFIKLIGDGVDFKRIDKVMEKFGWPMGPAYLMDVVGIDTGVHAGAVMAEAFPDRMAHTNKTIVEVMNDNKRFGQKNGKGFYEYELDRRGRLKKSINEDVYEIISQAVTNKKEVTDEENNAKSSVVSISSSE